MDTYREFAVTLKIQMGNDRWFHWDRLLYTCVDWRQWANQEQEKYTIGLTHGLRWWMEWELNTGPRRYYSKWENAKDAITDQDVRDRIDAYCVDPSDDLLSRIAVKIAWRLAQERGVPLPEI